MLGLPPPQEKGSGVPLLSPLPLLPLPLLLLLLLLLPAKPHCRADDGSMAAFCHHGDTLYQLDSPLGDEDLGPRATPHGLLPGHRLLKHHCERRHPHTLTPSHPHSITPSPPSPHTPSHLHNLTHTSLHHMYTNITPSHTSRPHTSHPHTTTCTPTLHPLTSHPHTTTCTPTLHPLTPSHQHGTPS